MIERQIALLEEIPVQELFVSVRQGVAYPSLSARMVFDRIPNQGPMGGLQAALESCKAPLMLVLAVDMPRVSVETLRKLVSLSSPGRGAVPRSGAGFEPLCATYPTHRDVRDRITRRIKSGQLSLQNLLVELVADGCIKAIESSDFEAGVFANWNTPQDMDEGVQPQSTSTPE